MGFNLADILKDVPNLGTEREQIEYISLDLIDSDPNNFYQLSKLDELADNIATCGLQQPIRVRPHPEQRGRYMIVSGHRRRAALELLAAEEPQRWREAPCIVEYDEASPALQQLRVIYGNSNTRVLTAAEISEQAVQVEKLLYQLKEEGHEFPGRMRDHVAQVVQVSKSKLSRLKMIRDNLVDKWYKLWESNDISEQTAYHLSQLPGYEQYFIYEHIEKKYGNAKDVSASVVEKYAKRRESVLKCVCPAEGTSCGNVANKREATIRCGLYDHHPCVKCCAACYKLTSCKYACPKLSAEIEKKRAAAREEKRQAKQAETEKHASTIAAKGELWVRFGQLRKESGKSVKDVCQEIHGCFHEADAARYEERENGNKITDATILPFGFIQLYEINRLIKIADLFGCSLDYLLCRTNEPHLQENVPKLGTGWNTSDPEQVGFYAVVTQFDDCSTPDIQKMMWTGYVWKCGNYEFDPDVDGKLIGWLPFPEGQP